MIKMPIAQVGLQSQRDARTLSIFDSNDIIFRLSLHEPQAYEVFYISVSEVTNASRDKVIVSPVCIDLLALLDC